MKIYASVLNVEYGAFPCQMQRTGFKPKFTFAL